MVFKLETGKSMIRTGDSDEASYVPKDIFGGQPLGIFTEPLPASAEPQEVLTTWRKCVQRELELLGTPSPRNALEEHILWTEQGKLWKFPIDNEQDLEYAEEKFHHHVFLTQHLQPWCPASGPIRHFMELICVGLSKNPYASVEYKKKTILWFKSYFERAEINEILVHQGLWAEQNQSKEV
ncbi:28S ribosomal protein S31, mitochondrial-like [Eurytemora carolleeae]|uniref:28S ribosomal protein S31, mitochondrial-like n=1 Tax=Eurytemora carolleeae TaxID=1294199 RepID=UPI000C78C627|nr:28S ribosomal protein S31, mitochondrial-like [Eurytemora carolleeae]|eukprot:XP_023340669.1 28S ribosomal protein S31, mitochondrial-like [Eurytemora affinis]